MATTEFEITDYVDRDGRQVAIGDILKYDEGEGYAKGVHEVVLVNGEPHGVLRVGEPRWSLTPNEPPMPLECYTSSVRDENVLIHCTVIGNVSENGDMLTPFYAVHLFGGAGSEKMKEVSNLLAKAHDIATIAGASASPTPKKEINQMLRADGVFTHRFDRRLPRISVVLAVDVRGINDLSPIGLIDLQVRFNQMAIRRKQRW